MTLKLSKVFHVKLLVCFLTLTKCTTNLNITVTIMLLPSSGVWESVKGHVQGHSRDKCIFWLLVRSCFSYQTTSVLSLQAFFFSSGKIPASPDPPLVSWIAVFLKFFSSNLFCLHRDPGYWYLFCLMPIFKSKTTSPRIAYPASYSSQMIQISVSHFHSWYVSPMNWMLNKHVWIINW